MAQSKRYRDLERRIEQLATRLLPPRSPTGVYSDTEYDLTRAFRVLAHAEIEACLEDLAMAAVDAACTAWTTDGKARKCITALIAYHAGGLSLPSSSGAPVPPLRERVDAAKRWFSHQVRVENHGIRETNVIALLIPAGVAHTEIDSVWLGTIDSFGQDRGVTAHTSAVRVTTPPDPVRELATVNAIVMGLADIDSALKRLVYVR